MACFGLCDACRTEFETLDDRRFHAQTIACPNCGPSLWFESAWHGVQCDGGDAFDSAIQVIRAGGILALKGLGGYQLICDARNPEAVKHLRRRKRRESKPLAVMISNREIAEGSQHSDDTMNAHEEHLAAEIHALTSPMNPIVLVSMAESLTCASLSLAAEVSGGFKTTGLMLPTTPLHAVLLETLQTPLVVTSGNADSEPIVFEEGSARQNLTGIADGWLHHNRPIERPIDDSVVRIIAGQTVTIRAGRGIAPLRLPLQTTHRILAVGGEQKVACAFSNGHQTVLGPHLGNMSSLAMRKRFTEHVGSLERLYGAVPDTIVHDLHPDYFTSRWANDRGIRTLAVQHHHAHVVSCMLEHQILNSEVLGVAFDGTGLGADGTIWGGEFLLATQSSFRRIGHLMPFLLPGGEKAIDEPWRTAVSLLTTAIPEISAEDGYKLLQHHGNAQDCCIRNPAHDASCGGVALAKIRQVQQLVRGGHGPFTSSMGRIFDGISAIITGISQSGFEGEAAMRLESICDESTADSDTSEFECVFVEHNDTWCIDWRPIVKGIVRCIKAGESAAAISRTFHLAIADVVVSFVERFPGYKVVLSGGCFQNRILSETISGRLALFSREVFTHGRVPPNDGGLAAGQMAVAAALLDLELEQEVGRCV
jgi:hydrogenase maturation protein HypF